MSVKDRYTAIADALRNQYGTTDKYKLADMPKMINGLEIHNFLDADESLNWPGDGVNKPIKSLSVDTWNKSFLGKTITISFDATWSGFKTGRIGIEYAYQDKNGSQHYYGSWFVPASEEGSKHCATTLLIDTIGTTSFEEQHMYNQCDAAVVKITNPKIVVNPMGG